MTIQLVKPHNKCIIDPNHLMTAMYMAVVSKVPYHLIRRCELGGTSHKRASPVRGGGGVRICCLQGLTMANTFIRTWALMTELQKKARGPEWIVTVDRRRSPTT